MRLIIRFRYKQYRLITKYNIDKKYNNNSM